ncbi:hypothetical protein [Campylobacter jejuni]|uniref:hypothetical protein n=1 Tax=Campylobacter jejuni TaxID=197 RepID=UPI00073DD8D0|nr:hypothetical protein [Campylobacter jejuni]ALW15586.1 hypothetical protein RC26_02515 [Campylobacter jejuni]
MKIEVEFYSDELKEVTADEAFEIYENLYYIEQEKFINSFLKNADKIEILKKILENCSKEEKEEIKKLLEY